MVTYTYHQIRRIDTEAFCHDIRGSRLYDSTTTDADEYAELFDSETRRVLDSHAPLLTRRRRRGQHDIRHLSDDARRAKQERRRVGDDLSAGIIALVLSQIDAPTSMRLVRLVTVFRDRVPTTSEINWTLYLVMWSARDL